MRNPTVAVTRIIATCAALLALTCHARAGLGTITGKEAEGWDSGYYNVVVGTIHDVQKEQDQPPERHRALLVPRATLGGTFDCSLHPKLPVTFYIGAATSSVTRIPPEGASVLVLIQFLPGENGQTAAGFIFSDICTFMPDKSAMVVINGMDDPRLVDTLKRLQDARAHRAPSPYRKPTDKPAPGDAGKKRQ